ncbi:cytochrome P450 [Nakamurella flava]|uniref:Cytochrome P450 n=1 Tax=Nakamurella flava TaxID=2576308 RepID=A0A4U6QL26_9ACTN|nr:cytochrome P450 [Nakamurella flava]TKV61237.1 cytochrome P450 [Nakamurella flava]
MGTDVHTADRPPAGPAIPPHFAGRPIVGAGIDLQRDFLGTLLTIAAGPSPVTKVVAGPPGWRREFYLTSHPDAVGPILSAPERWVKQTATYEIVRRTLGNGMLTAEGDEWRRQRRFLAPVFTPRRIAGAYADIIVDETSRLADRWDTTTGRTVDVHADMVELTARIIGRILFGADMTEAIRRITRVAFVNEALMRRGLVPHPLPLAVPTPGNRRVVAGLREIRSVASDLIAERRRRYPSGRSTADDAQDMLSLLLNARDAENPTDRLTDQEVADQVLIFLLAGHETTASTLACGLVELARSPHWQAVLHSELDNIGYPPASADLPRLVWTGRAVRESLRLYPAAHTLGRRALADEILCGYAIPAGSDVLISPWVLHRSPRIWPEPARFDPTRFDLPDGALPGGSRHAWMPFGAGPHTCVGMQLAMTEAPLVLAGLLRRFEFTTELTSVPLTAAVSLRPSRPLPVSLRAR